MVLSGRQECRSGKVLILLAIALIGVCVREVRAIDPYLGNDPYWVLLHEPSVVDDLKLSPTQREAWTKLLDELDVRFFPLRNKPSTDAVAGMDKIVREAQDRLKSICDATQVTRLNEILLQQQGNASFSRDDVASGLKYSTAQRKQMKAIAAEADTAVAALQKVGNDRSQRESSEKKYVKIKTDEQKKLIAVLSSDQLDSFRKMLGSPFPLAELRKPAFKAPELIDTDEWINSSPLSLSSLQGKVVVVHFYASACSNCIHNYPWYRQWYDQYKRKDVVLIGIHTPEIASERDSDNVRRKAAEEKLAFPILIDGRSENWNAWGNSMWPSVYLIDKRGYLRDFWAGELKWQGNDGEKYMRDRIDELLTESASRTGVSR